MKAVPQPAAKATEKDVLKAIGDKRLFVRLGSDHPWRKLSPCSVRQKIQGRLQCAMGNACSPHRVRTGFAILTRDENTREMPLDAASKLSDFNAKVEEAPNLGTFQIANIPATIRILDGIRTVDADWILTEIHYRTRKVALQM